MKKLILIVLTVLFCITSCSKKGEIQQPENTKTQVNKQENTDNKQKQNVPKKAELDFSFLNNFNFEKTTYVTSHQKYLDEELVFNNRFDNISNSSECCLVASDKCKLYPENFLQKQEDGKYDIVYENMEGIPIPFGTILEPADGTFEEYSKSEDANQYYSYYGYFYFEDNYNYFYKVRYNDKVGYVFGADLLHDENTIVKDRIKNNIYSELFLKNGVLNEFYPYLGDTKITNQIVLDSLTNNRLAIQRMPLPKYLRYDDMIDAYLNIVRSKATPVFITTDLLSHSQHLIFDRVLQRVEENFFVPKLLEVTNLFIDRLQKQTDVPKEIKENALKYFQVGQLILRLAPNKVVSDDWNRTVTYEEISNAEQIKREYPSDVLEEYTKIMTASGTMSMFGTKEMFNQYKPRGHYTKNGILESYFRAQMWFGRIHFIIAKSNFNPKTDEECAKMAPIAMFIVNTVKQNPDLYDAWASIFDPITTLIGDSDDLSFSDIIPVWEEQKVGNFTEWANNQESLKKFVQICHDRLRPPAISGNSLLLGASETDENGNEKPPMGWRFLGQRFTYDSYVHQNVCAPKLITRDFVRGLDIMKAFGSKTAEILLSQEDYTDNSSNFYGGQILKDNLNFLENEFNSYDTSFWKKNYYNAVLGQIKTQATFEQGSGYYFTESPLWNIKSMISSHSTWAELRHDTILYVKQVVAERGGDGDIDCTWRTKEIPLPTNYIEPNTSFWNISLASVQRLMDTLNHYNFLDDEVLKVLTRLSEIYKNAIEISELESENKPISYEQNSWIRTIPSMLSFIVFVDTYSFASSEDELRMSCVADVFTNEDYNVCLETGIARTLKIYVPLNDGQGGKRIAVGFIPDYCEFYHDADNRLTDEEWKKIVYNNDTDFSQYEPFWEKTCIIDND